jgi:hypothetical protein
MSTPNSPGQPRASREWGYSRGWRRFSVIVLRPLLMLAMKHRWQGISRAWHESGGHGGRPPEEEQWR